MRIRGYQTQDIPTIHQLVEEPEIYRHQIWGPNSLAATTQFVELCITNQRASPRTHFENVVEDLATGEVIGAIGIRIQDQKARKADIGYWICKDRWGEGLATEATRAVLKFGFTQLNLNRVWATASTKNPASIRVLEKAGMLKEGMLRSDLFIRGEYRDSQLLAVLKNEFPFMDEPIKVISK